MSGESGASQVAQVHLKLAKEAGGADGPSQGPVALEGQGALPGAGPIPALEDSQFEDSEYESYIEDSEYESALEDSEYESTQGEDASTPEESEIELESQIEEASASESEYESYEASDDVSEVEAAGIARIGVVTRKVQQQGSAKVYTRPIAQAPEAILAELGVEVASPEAESQPRAFGPPTIDDDASIEDDVEDPTGEWDLSESIAEGQGGLALTPGEASPTGINLGGPLVIEAMEVPAGDGSQASELSPGAAGDREVAALEFEGPDGDELLFTEGLSTEDEGGGWDEDEDDPGLGSAQVKVRLGGGRAAPEAKGSEDFTVTISPADAEAQELEFLGALDDAFEAGSLIDDVAPSEIDSPGEEPPLEATLALLDEEDEALEDQLDAVWDEALEAQNLGVLETVEAPAEALVGLEDEPSSDDLDLDGFIEVEGDLAPVSGIDGDAPPAPPPSLPFHEALPSGPSLQADEAEEGGMGRFDLLALDLGIQQGPDPDALDPATDEHARLPFFVEEEQDSPAPHADPEGEPVLLDLLPEVPLELEALPEDGAEGEGGAEERVAEVEDADRAETQGEALQPEAAQPQGALGTLERETAQGRPQPSEIDATPDIITEPIPTLEAPAGLEEPLDDESILAEAALLMAAIEGDGASDAKGGDEVVESSSAVDVGLSLGAPPTPFAPGLKGWQEETPSAAPSQSATSDAPLPASPENKEPTPPHPTLERPSGSEGASDTQGGRASPVPEGGATELEEPGVPEVLNAPELDIAEPLKVSAPEDAVGLEPGTALDGAPINQNEAPSAGGLSPVAEPSSGEAILGVDGDSEEPLEALEPERNEGEPSNIDLADVILGSTPLPEKVRVPRSEIDLPLIASGFPFGPLEEGLGPAESALPHDAPDAPQEMVAEEAPGPSNEWVELDFELPADAILTPPSSSAPTRRPPPPVSGTGPRPPLGEVGQSIARLFGEEALTHAYEAEEAQVPGDYTEADIGLPEDWSAPSGAGGAQSKEESGDIEIDLDVGALGPEADPFATPIQGGRSQPPIDPIQAALAELEGEVFVEDEGPEPDLELDIPLEFIDGPTSSPRPGAKAQPPSPWDAPSERPSHPPSSRPPVNFGAEERPWWLPPEVGVEAKAEPETAGVDDLWSSVWKAPASTPPAPQRPNPRRGHLPEEVPGVLEDTPRVTRRTQAPPPSAATSGSDPLGSALRALQDNREEFKPKRRTLPPRRSIGRGRAAAPPIAPAPPSAPEAPRARRSNKVSDRRRNARVVDVGGKVYFRRRGRIATGTLRDLSFSGCAVLTQAPLAPGTEVPLGLEIGGMRTIRAISRVVWCRQSDPYGVEGESCMGVIFQHLEPEDRRLLSTFLSRVSL